MGKTYSPVSGGEVKKDSVQDVVEFVKSLEDNTKLYILAPIKSIAGKPIPNRLSVLNQQGFTRVKYKGEVIRLEDVLDTYEESEEPIFLVVDLSLIHI